MNKFTIIGAGMAGFGAAFQLSKGGIEATIYEKNDHFGGQAASSKKNGFIFDNGPHFSLTKHKKIRRLFHKAVEHQVNKFDVVINNFWEGYWIKHPLLVNLYGLPKDIVIKIIREYFEAGKSEVKTAANYKEWLYKTYGKTFTETFLLDFTEKYYTAPVEKLDADWIGIPAYQPNLLEVVAGANSYCPYNYYYIKNYHYPANGGFSRFLDPFVKNSHIKYSHDILKIDPVNKKVTFKKKGTENYDSLISTIPLPELVKRIEGVPKDVLSASEKLAYTSCILVNIGVTRNDISKAHWTNFFDKDVLFSRVSFPHMFSSGNVPENCGSIQAEIYFSNKYKPLSSEPDEFIEPTIYDLKRCGVIDSSDELIYKDARLMPYANIIFDHDRAPNLALVHKYLDSVKINYCGQFGNWGFYHGTDESFMSGEKIAKKLLKQQVPTIEKDIVHQKKSNPANKSLNL